MSRTGSGLWKWIVTIAVVSSSAAAAVTVERWLSTVALWVTSNSNTVQGLEALLQIVFWTISGVLLVGQLWRTARQRHDALGASGKGLLPPLPQLVVGRKAALQDLKRRIGVGGRDAEGARLVAVTGWPGVGKSTMAAALAHDQEVSHRFDGPTLWAYLGSPHADLRMTLRAWGRAVDVDLSWEVSESAARAKLAAHLGDKSCLLILDDVWSPDQVQAFRVGGPRSAVVVTTRLPGVGSAVAPTPSDVVQLPALSTDDGLTLLSRLAPAVVKEHREGCRDLVEALEGLPLALQVAGRLLNAESRSGLDVSSLLLTLRSGGPLLRANAPVDMMVSTTPTVAALLRKSTEELDPLALERFAALGVMAGRVAEFEIEALKTMWETDRPEETVRLLVDRGLLEFDARSRRYRMHSLLLAHARSLLEG